AVLFSSRIRHTRLVSDWSSDVCSSDLAWSTSRGTIVVRAQYEIMLLPTWFPFHLSKISYWARTTIVPLLVLQALKPKARNPRGEIGRASCRERVEVSVGRG